VRNPRVFLAFFGLISSLSVLACGSKDEPAAAACDKFDYTKYTPASTALTFTADIYPIIKTSCSLAKTCHGATAAAMGDHNPQMGPIAGTTDPAALKTIHDAIVGVDAAEAPSLKYVKAGDPENSWLMKKVEGVQACTGVACVKIPEATSACGDSMPSMGDLIPATDRAKIRDWIKGNATL
jgi:hypothetical protein